MKEKVAVRTSLCKAFKADLRIKIRYLSEDAMKRIKCTTSNA